MSYRDAIFLSTVAVLLFTGACSSDQSGRVEEQQRQIRELQSQTDSLRRGVKTYQDSLRTLLRQRRELETRLARQDKLEALLMDNRTGLWSPDDRAMYIRFADSTDAETVADLVAAFNERFAGSFNPRLTLESVEGAVARVGVGNDAQLTEQMGSTGSTMYLATMTYTLTSLCRVDSVYLDVEPGSHARPGYYSRESWVHLVEE